MQQALDHMMAHDFDLGMRDVEAVIHWIRREEGVAKVGFVGFCMGGRIAYMAATRTDVDASVGYYGVMIDQMLGEKHAIARPLMLHIPMADHFVDAAAQRAMHEGLDDHPRVTLHDYAGLDHGFAAEIGARRDEAGATLADGRTEAFFAEHVG
jgi:carboxymethylenebutenolidase